MIKTQENHLRQLAERLGLDVASITEIEALLESDERSAPED